MQSFNKNTLWLALVLILGFALRLYKIDNPVADWHSWRQADTAAVVRNFVNEGIDFLHPKVDDLSSIASGKPNPQGYRFVEFPIYNVISAFWVKMLPGVFTVEIASRFVSIFCSLSSCAFLFLITKKYLGVKTGLLAAFFFSVLPYNIYYGRVILPEPMMVAASLGMVYFFDRWLEERKLLFCYLAILFAAVGLLLKPIVGFLALPMAYFVFKNFGWRMFKQKNLYLFLILSVTPFILWRFWMSRFPEGIPAYLWLLNQDKIRFKGAFFYWLFAKRLGELILGFWGLIPLGLGLILKQTKKEGWFFHFWFLAILVYFSVFATGNVRHDYYQIISIPIICIFLAKGAIFLFSPKGSFARISSFLLLASSFLFMLAFSWYQVRTYYWINRPEIVEAGEAVNRFVPEQAKVVAPYGGDTAFLYQTKRKGWPIIEAPLEEMRQWGAEYLVSVETEDEGVLGLKEKYKTLMETDRFIIFNLNEPL